MRAFIVAVALATVSCARPTDAAQVALASAAEAIVIVDEYTAEWYTRQADEALSTAESLDEYEELMKEENAVEQSLRISRAALTVMQDALDAWKEGDEGGWMPALKCGVIAMTSLYDVMLEAGLEPPGKIAEAIQQGMALIKGEVACR